MHVSHLADVSATWHGALLEADLAVRYMSPHCNMALAVRFDKISLAHAA